MGLSEISTPKKHGSRDQDHGDTPRRNLQGILLEEEQRVREELESDIERELEEEIKDGIRRLAVRLHRLYQHKGKNRLSSKGAMRSELDGEDVFTEVNITIKMEGGCKIEINESTTYAAKMSHPFLG